MSYVASLNKSEYYIFEYLIQEVLTRQSPDIQQFLLYTSILEQFTAPLCDAIFSEDIDTPSMHRSSEILNKLEILNLFLIIILPVLESVMVQSPILMVHQKL
jgi:LuxR family maltose regulon positive regulatory protein